MISLGLATPADDAGIRRLLATNAMPGRIRVRFEREPSYFAGCDDPTQVLVARDGERVVGVACRTMQKLYVNGVAEEIGYLGQLRVDRAYRGQLLTARGYRVMRELHEERPARGYYTTIVEGNAQAEGVLVRKSRGVMPHYRFLETLHKHRAQPLPRLPTPRRNHHHPRRLRVAPRPARAQTNRHRRLRPRAVARPPALQPRRAHPPPRAQHAPEPRLRHPLRSR